MLESGAGKRVRVLLYGLCTGLLSYLSRKEVCGIDSTQQWEYSTVLRVRVYPTCLGTTYGSVLRGAEPSLVRTRKVYCTCVRSTVRGFLSTVLRV